VAVVLIIIAISTAQSGSIPATALPLLCGSSLERGTILASHMGEMWEQRLQTKRSNMMDAEIVQLHQEANLEESLRRFAATYQLRLYTLARRLLGNHDDALDALQEILMRMDKSLPTFKGESSLYTWAFRLATNVCLNYKL
jgi:hypothetical protein